MQGKKKWIAAILAVSSAFLVASCTALLDWHLHDTKVAVDDKELTIEGSPSTEPGDLETQQHSPDGENTTEKETPK